ncbi:DNA mismatch repair protein MutS [Monaibacterium marinum]|uniref:DNA mismatch repair protein MutS n=2 Tax=Pontivivens marinum TaxID=1690039 RepID=A0A2C9CPJ4_9RHOB|nr:DNA mismatch repair protein MutS [Monaibacterium marinum]
MGADMANGATPMMVQFLEIKAQYPDALLFYRMGDFYEMFFDDAIAASAALDIALTKRGKHDGEDIAMCGVPQHAAEGYLLTLIRKGFRVAVCDQMESPAEAKKRGYKAVVKREVVRLVTPGTLTEDTLLDARRHNYLAAYAQVRDSGAYAWLDLSTGELHVTRCPKIMLGPMLARTSPREVLVVEGDVPDSLTEDSAVITPLARASFDSEGARTRLERLYGTGSLDGFGQFDRAELGALGALIDYIDITQKGRLPLIHPPVQEQQGAAMQIDAATRRNLELTHALSGGREGGLLNAIDRTVTGAGARLLETRVCAPSTDLTVIRERLDAVQLFVDDRTLSADLRDALRQAPDMDRALSRLALDRGGPRDLASIRNGLTAGARMGAILSGELPEGVAQAAKVLSTLPDCAALLESALVAEPPLLKRDGGFVTEGVDVDLDEARTLRDEGRGVIASMQAKYAELAGVTALKIKHNNVLGYFIETTATHAEKMMSDPLSDTFIHRQTTANAVRFTTVELSELETRILNAGARTLELELEQFDRMRDAVLNDGASISTIARALAELDVASALAELAVDSDWTRPKLDMSRSFNIVGGRHPVVERALQRQGGADFIPNDCDLTAQGDNAARIILLTGPNMAGKSTWLRQNAIIALLAQIGAYVPAASAEIGLVDQLFSRVGAADDLARGRSTFMVEMVETAAILNRAGPRAMVILDEIGRGTATYDGLSIAWAVMEHLHEVNGARALFATHYHEMTGLSAKLDGVSNATVAVREWEGNVVFLHEVREGAADRSYGVQVARLAGLPDSVVDRARSVLKMLESEEHGGKAKLRIDDLPLFAVPVSEPAAPKADSQVESRLADILPDGLTPREALDLIYELKGLMPQ